MSTSTKEELYHEEFTPPFLPALIILPFLLPIFWKFKVTVTEDALTFGYNLKMSSKSASRSQIVGEATVEPSINGLSQWGGWGIRYNLAGDVGYIAKNGPGVRVKIQKHGGNGETVYVFNCKDPEKVCKILNSGGGSTNKEESEEYV